MIVGTGTDIIEVERIRKSLDLHGEAFKERVYTDEEIRESSLRKDPSVYFAGRWAAKEALSKALGCGISAKCGWRDINVSNSEGGRPSLTLSGKARETAEALGVRHIHISISHERNLATAVVILESL